MAISEYHDYDYVAENRTHYDKHANVLETDEEFSRVARQIAEGILRVHGSLFDKSSTTLMDFACGTGMKYSSFLQRQTHRFIRAFRPIST